jgi:hypothetical protein
LGHPVPNPGKEKETGTLVFDARSRDKYELLHVAGHQQHKTEFFRE